MTGMNTPASPKLQGPLRTSYWQHLCHVASENPVTGLAFGLFALIVGMALFGPYLVPFDPLDTGVGPALQAPSGAHWFGTDHLGRDVFSRVVVATRLDMINLPFYARMARAEVSIRRNAGFVQAARLSGNSELRVLFGHIFPNTLPPMMVQISLNMGWAILNAAGLSFIGLGVQPPAPEWGIMVAEGANFIISGEWWLVIFPGMALMLAVFTFNLIGDGLRDLVDPQRRT